MTAPTAPGYYWVDLQDGEGPRIVELKAVQGDPRFEIEDYTAVLFTGTDADADLSDFDSTPGVRWVGPLKVPKKFDRLHQPTPAEKLSVEIEDYLAAPSHNYSKGLSLLRVAGFELRRFQTE